MFFGVLAAFIISALTTMTWGKSEKLSAFCFAFLGGQSHSRPGLIFFDSVCRSLNPVLFDTFLRASVFVASQLYTAVLQHVEQHLVLGLKNTRSFLSLTLKRRRRPFFQSMVYDERRPRSAFSCLCRGRSLSRSHFHSAKSLVNSSRFNLFDCW